jgi:amino acid transporter
MEMAREDGAAVKPQLGLWDAVSIIVGIVIGSTIYKSPQLIMANVTSPAWGLGAWVLGGVLSLVGALCYAELSSTYPRSGGDYVYLTRAFGDWCGFLFGWAQLSVILTSSVAMMAFVFGDYAVKLWPPPDTVAPQELLDERQSLRESVAKSKPDGPEAEQLAQVERGIKPYEDRREVWTALFAAAAVTALTLMNMLGVVLGKWTQNLLSLLKVVGLSAIVVVGFMYGKAEPFVGSAPLGKDAGFGMAMIFVLYAYGGWSDAAFVAAEVRTRRKIILALILGTALVTVIYLAVNVAYLRALGFEGMRNSWAVAADVCEKALGANGSRAISVLVMISALGAINGLLFTRSRLCSALGADHSIFALLARWHPTLKTPVWALLVQAAIALAMIAAVGTAFGRDAIDAGMRLLALPAMPWEQYFGGFDTLLSGTAPVFWAFFLLSGLSLFALRERDPDIERPFRVPVFPLLPLIFCGSSAYMLYSAVAYAKYIALIGAVPLAVGLPLYWLSRRTAADGGGKVT